MFSVSNMAQHGSNQDVGILANLKWGKSLVPMVFAYREALIDIQSSDVYIIALECIGRVYSCPARSLDSVWHLRTWDVCHFSKYHSGVNRFSSSLRGVIAYPYIRIFAGGSGQPVYREESCMFIPHMFPSIRMVFVDRCSFKMSPLQLLKCDQKVPSIQTA